MEKLYIVCKCLSTISTDTNSSALAIWVPAIVSVISLVVTTIFTVYIAPKIAAKNNQKTAMYTICAEFFDYLTDIVSLENYDGVPSKIRKYSLKIHLMFKSGTAPQNISDKLEDLFQKTKKRKTLSSEEDISNWENEYRTLVRELRIELSEYVGVFSSK